jgi:hypothetical protein
MVGQLVAENAFLANVAVFKTGDKMLGSLLEEESWRRLLCTAGRRHRTRKKGPRFLGPFQRQEPYFAAEAAGAAGVATAAFLA